MFKRMFLLFAALTFVIFIQNTNSEPRRMVLEFCTGTWCGYCPCGHAAADQILIQYPNTIVIAYHGSSTDPWKDFTGNTIRSMLGFSAYPTGVFDRTNHPGNNGAPYPYVTSNMWVSYAQSRYNSTPNSRVDAVVTATGYNTTTREYTATIQTTANVTLTGQYKIVYVLTEDNVVYPQYFYASCGSPVGYHNDYVHMDIARIVINGATGENLNTGTWNQNQVITKSISTILDASWVPANCNVNIIVYKDSSDLFFGTVEQGTKQGVTSLVGITSNNNEVPEKYSLNQNYPNPFNPTTNIQFTIPKDGFVTLRVFNSSGQLVETYTDGFMSAGSYNVDVDGTQLSSGIYFYTLTAGDFRETKKMILIK
ncbi:MAG: Omp28-related outer membrane protein [Ignavibacteria bacterium]|nr:Omp28-related outer membrane protein [Ignavibacteria bacterium]